MTETLRNWAGNYAFRAERVHRPESVEAVQEAVAGSRRVRALGTRHSFNAIADSEGDLVSVVGLNRIVGIEGSQATIEAGVRYGELCEALDREGLALHNLASLPHISVGGSVATSTHGSGVGNGSLSTVVSGLEIVRADGSLVSLKRGDEGFDGAVVGLGALGVVVRLTLDVVPAFSMRQTVYERLPFAALEVGYDEIASSAYSVSLFTSWSSDVVDQVWVKRLDGSLEPSIPATPADGPRHPLPGFPVENCTEQMGVPGPWFERLPHFRLRFTPSGGEELQSEFLLPRRFAFAAFKEVDAMRERIAPLLFVSEIRTVAADGLWMSPAYKEDCVAIHFTWKPMWEGVRAVLPEIEARLAPFGARPHWGKLFAGSARGLYPRQGDFEALARSFDPEGKFRNGFLEEKLFR